jgi:hypothetical protein
MRSARVSDRCRRPSKTRFRSSGAQLRREGLTEAEEAEIVARWTGNPVTRHDEG